MKPRVVGLMSVYDELPEFISTTIRTAAPLIDHLVYVDGRYAHFAPDRPAVSDPEQHAAAVFTCLELGIGLSLHIPTEPWESELTKRTAMFRAGDAVARPGRSWFWILDGDEFTAQLEITPDEVLALEQDAAVVRFVDPAEKSDIKLRNLFRALPGITVGPVNHFTFRAPDGRVLWGRGEVDAADLSRRIAMQHANHLRPERRRLDGQRYYIRRDAIGLERGDCERCRRAKATRTLPHRWRRDGGRLAGEYAEFCDDCVHEVRRRNRVVLGHYGQDESITVWANNQAFVLRDLYWNWSHLLAGAGWQLPERVARRYDALLDRGDHQAAGRLVERYRPAVEAGSLEAPKA